MCGIILTFARKKEIAMSLMGLPLWAWIVFYVLVLLMLVADLKMFGRKGQHEVLFWGIFGALVLRSIFIFAGAAMVERFECYLKYGLGIILIFVGVKMLLAMNEYINALGTLLGLRLNMPHIEVPTPVSLAVIFGVLVLSMLLSVAVTRRKS